LSSTVTPLVPAQLNPPLDIVVVSDEAGLVKVQHFFEEVSVFGLDIETNVVDSFHDRRVRTIQVGDKNRQFVIDLLPFVQAAEVNLVDTQGNFTPHPVYKPILDVLRPVLESRQWLKIGHNLSFEYETLKWSFGLRPWNFYDTFWTEKVIHTGEWPFKASGLWALDDVVLRYTGLQMSKDEQTTFTLDTPLTDSQIVYAALDVRVLFAVKSGQRPLIEKANLWKTVQIENDAIPAFGDMHLNGILLNLDPWLEIISEIEDLHRKNVARLDQFFVPAIGSKTVPKYDLKALEDEWRDTREKEARAEARKRYMAARNEVKKAQKELDDYEGEAALNYASPAQLLDALRKMGFDKKALESTDDRSLKKAAKFKNLDMDKALKEDPTLQKYGVIDVLRLYRETAQVLKSYGQKFIKKHVRMNPDCKTGWVHSRINQLGAETGRTSSKDPNIQNIKREARWRACFIAPPGRKMLTLDYNGCELRILAEYSREKVWLDAFKKGWDVHSVGAEIIFGDEWKEAAEEGCAYYAKHEKCKCKKHKELRDRIKAINFGIAYGMEAKKLSEELNITEREASDLLKRYRAAFPTLVKYLEASGKSAAAKNEARTLAQRRRFFKKPTWEAAAKKATEKLRERGIMRAPTVSEINSRFKSMFASIEREGKNTPIQGSNADMAKLAMGCGFDCNGKPFLWHVLEPEFDGRQHNFVHDEIVASAPDDKADACFHAIGDCMVRAGAELVKSIPMTYEGFIDTKWRK
jgi:DNA polymerase I-like protein with 3'-5' exonuclease and polymerase domains